MIVRYEPLISERQGEMGSGNLARNGLFKFHKQLTFKLPIFTQVPYAQERE